ncbi:hypothetical protein [Kitasatospora sp. NPDC098663]|uniref:hypothetical protein n=1 Tax=Kitasatospora sp. NPDC098663 TaxID=3364096 RepID=UPI00381579DD
MAATPAHKRVRRLQNTETALRLTAATGLLVDAAVHLRFAHHYGAAAAVTLAMAFVLVWRRCAGDLYALAVCAADLATLLLHRYAGIGTPDPLPDAGEPLWSTATTLIACCQAIPAAALVALVVGRYQYLPWPPAPAAGACRESAACPLRAPRSPRCRAFGWTEPGAIGAESPPEPGGRGAWCAPGAGVACLDERPGPAEEPAGSSPLRPSSHGAGHHTKENS